MNWTTLNIENTGKKDKETLQYVKTSFLYSNSDSRHLRCKSVRVGDHHLHPHAFRACVPPPSPPPCRGAWPPGSCSCSSGWPRSGTGPRSTRARRRRPRLALWPPPSWRSDASGRNDHGGGGKTCNRKKERGGKGGTDQVGGRRVEEEEEEEEENERWVAPPSSADGAERSHS